MQLSQKHVQSYKLRDELLFAHGYRSYAEYLCSAQWRSKRQKFLASVDGKCVACGALDKLVVHHRCYSEALLVGDSLEYLVLLCENCHERMELTPRKTKRNLLHVDAELLRICPSLPKLVERQRARAPRKPRTSMTLLERIALNRKKAIRRRERKARKKAAKEAAKASRLNIPTKRRLEVVANLLANPRF